MKYPMKLFKGDMLHIKWMNANAMYLAGEHHVIASQDDLKVWLRIIRWKYGPRDDEGWVIPRDIKGAFKKCLS